MSKQPIVWTIAGSDSGGGAGIQADLHTFNQNEVFGCSVITAITAQNSMGVLGIQETSKELISGQIEALWIDLPPKAIKLGMLFSKKVMGEVARFLRKYRGYVVCDPVMISTSGEELLQPESKHFLIANIIPNSYLLTPNLQEAEVLVGRPLRSTDLVEAAAADMLSYGVDSVLVKGGDAEGPYSHDFWSDGKRSLWLTHRRIQDACSHGSGCSLSAAIAANVAKGLDAIDAIVMAKTYVTQGIRMGTQYGHGIGPVAHFPIQYEQDDLPWVTPHCIGDAEFPCKFPRIEKPLGLYPVVDRARWIERLSVTGISVIQLRIKDLEGEALTQEISLAVELAQKHHIRLFVNDYWQLTIDAGAYGVHLGQGDLAQANLEAIAKAGLRLGISTHCEEEIASALFYKPSYVAFGPIYHTESKQMTFGPAGLESLAFWCRYLDVPVVAIGGINADRFDRVVAAGANGVAMIMGIVNHDDPEGVATKMSQQFDQAALVC